MCTAKLTEVHTQRDSLGSWGAVRLCFRTRGTNSGSSHSRGSLGEEPGLRRTGSRGWE